uniref:Putative plant transposon protein domain-containing protein n=1 Tax=Cajanus cajan TaxID=3821 RepID=A0A151R6D3_CAJCA|nr:hypothetical protein KK1_040835 [Cajanus cajan]
MQGHSSRRGLSTTPSSRPRGGGRDQYSSRDLGTIEQNIFLNRAKQQRYVELENKKVIAERQVVLQAGECDEFLGEFQRRNWMRLTDLPEKYNEKIVKEFYANAWPIRRDFEVIRKSWVRGHWVSYDRDAINKLLGEPMVLCEGQSCSYQFIKKNSKHGFNNREAAKFLCLPGQSYESNKGFARRIIRGKMIKITRVWMTFLFANVTPTTHVSDI